MMSSDDDSDISNDPELRNDSSEDHVDAFLEAVEQCLLEDVIIMLSDHPEIIDEPGGLFRYTALQTASKAGQLEVVRFLLECGANVHAKGEHRYAPIHLASLSGFHQVVETLLAHGASVGDRDRKNNMTPISLAVRNDKIEVVRFLLACGANPRDEDFPANHPLHKACCYGYYEMVQILLDHGASICDWDASGRTPLHYACKGLYLFYDQMSNAVPMVTLLLENGADPNHPDKNGHYILEELRCSATVEEVVCDDVLVDWRDGLRPLLEMLLDYGAGSGLPCRSEDELHVKCNTTVSMCCFITFRREAIRNPPTRRNWHYEDVRDSFEGHFIKMSAAGLDSSKEEKPFEPPEKDLDWSKSKREEYRAQCEEEFERMATQLIADTCATYYNLLARDLHVLCEQDIWGKLTRDSCLRLYPVYGNMLHCSYLRTRRPILEMRSSEFFSILSPSLLPDCAEVVMRYLSNSDLGSLVAVCQSYQAFMKKSLESSRRLMSVEDKKSVSSV